MQPRGTTGGPLRQPIRPGVGPKRGSVVLTGNSAWIIPAITAGASLSGTIVGGLVTYWASRRNFEVSSEVDRLRNLREKVREAAIGFIASLPDHTSEATIDRIVQRWGAAASALITAKTDDELVKVARSIDPAIRADADRGAILYQLFRNTGVLDGSYSYSMQSLSELRLLAPEDVAKSAHRVLFRNFALRLTATLAPDATDPARDALNREINDFFNRVRHFMSVEDMNFDFIDAEYLSGMFPALPD